MVNNKYYPNFVQSIFIFILHVVLISSVSFFISFIYAVYLGIIGITDPDLIQSIIDSFVNSNIIYFSTIGVLISAIILTKFTLNKRKQKYKDFITNNFKKINFEIIFITLITAVSLSIIILNINSLIISPDYENPILETAFKGNVLGIIFALLIAPIFEEVIFRGIILGGLKKNYSIIAALMISALLFSISHFTLVQLVPTFIAGLYFGYIYYKSDSLILSMFAHFSYNLLPIIIVQFQEIGDRIINKTLYRFMILFVSILILAFGINFLRKKLNFNRLQITNTSG